MDKASLWRVPTDHSSTLCDSHIGRTDWWGVAARAFLPLIAGTATWKLGTKVADVGDAVSDISIVTGLLFTMAAFLFQLWTIPGNGKRLGENDFALVGECMTNTFWAILWGVTLTIYLIVCGARR